ncbi:F-box/kelch-repeat protein At3g06240-like [Bidens hawaiensis]|uniref:F-box/kelch-repeat protein At3g06240-like n=1 Tax=Bidens hawaiensis TaxID=980011 RepID=UPI00404926C8
MPRICPQLPIELLESEVLARLPAKSLGRFRCVCKPWNSILSTPTFAQFHLEDQTNYKYLRLNMRDQTFTTQDCDNMITKGPISFKDAWILASLDGMLCIALSFDVTRELALRNPLTRAYKKIRTSFDLDIGNGAFASFKDSCNDYKFVYIDTKDVFIYSLSLDSWRKIACLEIRLLISNFTWSFVTFLEGKVYFRVIDRSLECERCVVSYDVESEELKKIKFPCFPWDASLGVNVVALSGCIHLCVGYKDIINNGLKCDIWRLDGDEWIKAAAFTSPYRKSGRKMIHTKKNGNWFAICKDGQSVRSIGLEEFVTDNRSYDCIRHSYHEAVYIETLVSPNP